MKVVAIMLMQPGSLPTGLGYYQLADVPAIGEVIDLGEPGVVRVRLRVLANSTTPMNFHSLFKHLEFWVICRPESLES